MRTLGKISSRAIFAWVALFAAARALSADQEAVKQQIENGFARMKAEDFVGAIAVYTEVLRIDPDDMRALTGRACAYSKAGQGDLALGDMDRAIRLKPQDPEQYLTRASIYSLVFRDADRTISDCSQAIALDAKFSAAYRGRAGARAKKGDFTGARSDLDQAIALAPKDAASYSLRGLVHLALFDSAKALADCDEAIRLDPNRAESYGDRAIVFGQLTEWRKAIDDINKAISLSPKNANLYGSRAGLLNHLGEDAKARADLDEAIRLDPKNPFRYSQRANASQEPDEAIGYYTKAIALDPKFTPAYECRAKAYEVKGDTARAEADTAQARRLQLQDGLRR